MVGKCNRRVPKVIKDNHDYCYMCKIKAGELYHCDNCIRSFHPHCSSNLLKTMSQDDKQIPRIDGTWECDVCTLSIKDTRFEDEEDVVVQTCVSAATMIEMLFKNMQHDAANKNIKAIFEAFSKWKDPVRSRKKAQKTTIRMTTSRCAQSDDGSTSEVTHDDDANDSADSQGPQRVLCNKVKTTGASVIKATQRAPINDVAHALCEPLSDETALRRRGLSMRLRRVRQPRTDADDDDDDNEQRAPPPADQSTDNVRCMVCGACSARESGTVDQTHIDHWLCRKCRRVGVRIEIEQGGLATIRRVYQHGQKVDLHFDNGGVDKPCFLDDFSWRVVELSFDQRFINISSLFVKDSQSPLVEHTHQDDLIHFFSILRHLEHSVHPTHPTHPDANDSNRARGASTSVSIDDSNRNSIVIGLNNHVQKTDEMVNWPEHIDGQSVMCGVAFNSMKGSYTSGRQLPLYQFARLFRERLCIWRTVARIADSAPNTSFENEFADRIVPTYKFRYDKTKPAGVTRQRFKILDSQGISVLEWTYLIRHDPSVRCKMDDPIANSRVMMFNNDSCNVIIEKLRLSNALFWDFEQGREGTDARRGSGSDLNLGVYVRYIWKNFTKPSYMSHLTKTLKKQPWIKRLLRKGGVLPQQDLMLFVILLIKSLGDLGSACTVRQMNDQVAQKCALLHRPCVFHNFIWTFDKHISQLCAIITIGHVLFTPSVPNDNGVSIHGMFFEQDRWFRAICSAYRLGANTPHRPTHGIVVQMLFYISEHIRRFMSFTTCQQGLRNCNAHATSNR